MFHCIHAAKDTCTSALQCARLFCEVAPMFEGKWHSAASWSPIATDPSHFRHASPGWSNFHASEDQTKLKSVSSVWHQERMMNEIAFAKKMGYLVTQWGAKLFKKMEDYFKFEQQNDLRFTKRQHHQWFFHSSKIRPPHHMGTRELYSLSQLEMDGHCERSKHDFTGPHIIYSITWTNFCHEWIGG